MLVLEGCWQLEGSPGKMQVLARMRMWLKVGQNLGMIGQEKEVDGPGK